MGTSKSRTRSVEASAMGRSTFVFLALAIVINASPTLGADGDVRDTAGSLPHEAPGLEATLPIDRSGPTYRTYSLVAGEAAMEWDQSFLLHYILAGTCREVSDFEMAINEGYASTVLEHELVAEPWGSSRTVVRALRFSGADPARLPESYVQAMRFGGPAQEGTQESGWPYGGFIATPGWRPTGITLGEREVLRYGVDDPFWVYFAGDTVYEIDAELADAEHIVAALPRSTTGPPTGTTSTMALDCPDASEELLGLLPATLGDTILDPYPLPPGYAAGWLSAELAASDGDATISGYLLFVALGSYGAAFHAPGIESAQLRNACRARLDLRHRDARTVSWGGRRVLVDTERYRACYVRGDMVFLIDAAGTAKPFIRSIPPPASAQDPDLLGALDAAGAGPWPSTRLMGAEAITAGHDRFVVVGTAGGRKRSAKVWTSTDGLSWTRAPDSSSFQGAGMQAVIATDDGFVALGTDARNRLTAWHSPDGVAWDRGTVKQPGKKGLETGLRSVVDGPGGLLALGVFIGQDYAGHRMWRSTDGETWAPTRSPDVQSVDVLVAIPDGYWLLGHDEMGNDNAFWRSADGLTWERIEGLPWLRDAAVSDDGTVAAIGVATIWASDDLTDWQEVWLPPEGSDDQAELTWIDWDGAHFLTTGNVAYQYLECLDGVGWCPQQPWLISDDGYTWAESTGPDGLPGPDRETYLTAAATLGDRTVALGRASGGGTFAWLMQPAD
jgi:hypothetical protein